LISTTPYRAYGVTFCCFFVNSNKNVMKMFWGAFQG
jgi:hypothetical protein